MNREEIIQFLGSDWTRMKELMSGALVSDVELLSGLNRNILSHGGKMLRPMMSLLVSHACGTPGEDSLKYAAACELLHNATLVHDDVADESVERRGIPTVNATIGPSLAVLVGDFWLARSVSMTIGTAHYREVCEMYSKTLTDLSEGEMLQLQKADSGDTDVNDYFRIIYCKTASLFVSTAAAAVISVNAPSSYTDAVKEYARCLGIAFQIKDDILDYSGDEALGKPVGIDLKEKKITLPLLCAMENSPLEGEIRSKVALAGKDESVREEIKAFVKKNNGIGKASEILEVYIRKAVDALGAIPSSKARDYLCDLVRYNSVRKK